MQMRPILIVVVLFLLGACQAQAQLLFSLNPASQTGLPGSIVTYNATVANVGVSPVFLNGDGFAGIGTTLVAAMRLDRRWIGCDLSRRYCRIARDRLARVHEQVVAKSNQ